MSEKKWKPREYVRNELGTSEKFLQFLISGEWKPPT